MTDEELIRELNAEIQRLTWDLSDRNELVEHLDARLRQYRQLIRKFGIGGNHDA